MKKETSVAVFLGIFFGLILGLFLIFKNKQLQLETTKSLTPKTKVTVTVIPLKKDNVQFFTIEKPSDGIIVDSDKIYIEGKASSGSTIVIQSPVSQLTNKVTSDKFKIEFPLALGENVIGITAYPKDSQIRPVEKKITVYYLDNQL